MTTATHSSDDREDPVVALFVRACQPATKAARSGVRSEAELRSAYGSLPGEEFPLAIYGTIVLAYCWMLGATWLAFGGGGGDARTNLVLAIATLLVAIFIAIPILACRTATSHLAISSTVESKRVELAQFLDSRIETEAGTLSGWETWLQVILIPVALAVAASFIGAAYVWFT